jgi:hypothetical protein
LTGVRDKVKSFLRWWITPREAMDPYVRYPPRYSVFIIGTIGIILVEFYYFLYEFPFGSIPNHPLFLVSLCVWTLPPITVSWAYRNAPTRRELNAVANFFIGMGIVGIVLGELVGRIDGLLPIAYAAIPGLMAGGAIGGDSTLIWYVYKKRRGK